MSANSRSTVNHLGRTVTQHIPAFDKVPGVFDLSERDLAIWGKAKEFLKTRDNDAHSLYAYGIARALLSQIPQANEHIVLPAILLHDIGWSTVDERESLEAITPGKDGSREHLVFQHEKEGARIAREILESIGIAESEIAEIVAIIDGHDTRLTALNINDAIVKDSDKIWRVTPHGRGVVKTWFGLDDKESLLLCAYRAYNEVFTPEGRAMSRALVSIASIDLSIQISEIYKREARNQ